ncbi:MAG: hypothetical protein AABY32_01070 [Nanoarchaeota archaeon]
MKIRLKIDLDLCDGFYDIGDNEMSDIEYGEILDCLKEIYVTGLLEYYRTDLENVKKIEDAGIRNRCCEWNRKVTKMIQNSKLRFKERIDK